MRWIPAASVAAIVLGSNAPALAQSRKATLEACASASEAAQSLRADRKLALAREKLLVCTRAECPGPVKRDCDALLTQVDAAIPTLVLGARDAQGHDLVDVRVSLDGAPIQASLDGKPLAVDPGVHVLRFERAAGAAVEQSIVARESEKDRLIAVQFAGDAPTRTPPAPPADGSEPRATPWAGYVLAGVSLVGFGVFTYLDASGQSDFNGCKSSPCDVSALETKRIVTWSVLGVATVAAGAAIWLLATGGSRARSSAAAALVLGPGGIAGTF
jgi:hypothetical protein